MCIQHWLDVIKEYDGKADYYFVCDRNDVKQEIVKKCVFPSDNIKFIKSIRKQKIYGYVERLYTGGWRNATYAHVTPFEHCAKSLDCVSHWDIDADDTMLLMPANEIVKAFEMVERHSKDNGIDIISLDMWFNRTMGQHWSLGVVYVNENNNCLDHMRCSDRDWMRDYIDLDYSLNLDWYFNYLRNEKNLKAETFYIEKAGFIHWGEFLLNATGSGIYYWHDCMLDFPIYNEMMNDLELGRRNIINSCVRIDTKLTGGEWRRFCLDNVPNEKREYREDAKRRLKNLLGVG